MEAYGTALARTTESNFNVGGQTNSTKNGLENLTSFTYIMMRASWLLGSSILALALMVGIGASGETKKDKEKFKGQLPTGWKNLKDLSKDQILKIQTIISEYRGKIHDHEEKIKDLKVKERHEQVKLLAENAQAIDGAEASEFGNCLFELPS